MVYKFEINTYRTMNYWCLHSHSLVLKKKNLSEAFKTGGIGAAFTICHLNKQCPADQCEYNHTYM